MAIAVVSIIHQENDSAVTLNVTQSRLSLRIVTLTSDADEARLFGPVAICELQRARKLSKIIQLTE
jgi:hypothetical protein